MTPKTHKKNILKSEYMKLVWNNEMSEMWVCVNCLQVELDKLQNLYDAKMIEAQAELKTKLEKLSVDLESKWSETLK